MVYRRNQLIILHLIIAEPVYICIEWIQSAISVVYAEVPYAFISSPCRLAEIETDIKPVIIIKLEVVRRAVIIFLCLRIQVRKHGDAASLPPVPADVRIETFGYAVAGCDVDTMSVVVPVGIPFMPERIETSEVP
jgi:hypothetical protein